MAASYHLEKSTFTVSDFEQMSWHDCPIYDLSFTDGYKLLLDIDYIFKWVLLSNKKNFQFWIAPCTLIFDNVYKFACESDDTTLIIDRISKANPQKPKNAEHIGKELEYEWFIETTVGEISFMSVGYHQYVRKEPILIRNQKLEIQTRGGISFDTVFSRQS